MHMADGGARKVVRDFFSSPLPGVTSLLFTDLVGGAALAPQITQAS